MVRAVAEEALALASVTLFLAMVAVWAQVLGVICAPSRRHGGTCSGHPRLISIKTWMPATSDAVLRTAMRGHELSVRRGQEARRGDGLQRLRSRMLAPRRIASREY